MKTPWKKPFPPRCLTIAGSDSGGGAGIQADLKTFTVHGVYGMVAITSITAQNTKEVRAIYDVSPEVVASQIEAVSDDIGVDAAKTGMLSNKEIIHAVSSVLKKYDFPLVIDPVMVAKSGAKLLKDDAIEALKNELLPRAKIVTPNRMEAEILSNEKIQTIDDAIKAAKKIKKEYVPEAVVVKGGHISEDSKYAVDVLYVEDHAILLEGERVNGCTHGTGCSFSASIAANLAWGYDIIEAVKNAKEFITHSIKTGINYGSGHCPVNSSSWIYIPAEKFNIIKNLEQAVSLLVDNSEEFVKYYPEVGINLAMSLPSWYVKDENDVAGIPGRIIRIGKKLEACYKPEFGASKHVAKSIIAIQKHDPSIRAAMNLVYDESFLENAERLGYIISGFDRKFEPEDVKKTEGATTPWGIDFAIKKIGKVPDIIYDVGEPGKEALVFIFGQSAKDVVEKALRIIRSN
ncbi:bifunctional hydroxymethylpyrimidine kinase/phosphomethylpyrimidine kinase [Fervidicoccus fontis]|uniref:Bifunctional hydroxymethylpyrimidine kinase/phosphomethylpyrimidine kinase n=1 Tax=Fervidicoccus fontis TaxID=683846 RepID=A0A2J6N2G5_9CREN|nr:bifunctional hydroxymethylpyrimidine kinase/phosphomethylpyrimidine kinase [Fervidicoccus fontis]PMB75512.1 MAG: bifunctional hydroxymethylpyrimidine kinase/phosphomethylpyrimidine kinase [Fervidicoccus fontis]PMB78067.1 MAG: bifunctional hydroxymethylpyrimidine kinase/phosphomethylpyrimidine kinase [Fervidicoccus fontis]HEW64211.1 bifunctional hydroxymethylpyrimidine kinase/phosphomethylpyrimidine kinase [Fervidicoccus fontis]